jgi:nicotinamide mononucleotide transporter
MPEVDIWRFIEMGAVFCGILYVLLAASGSRWCWPPGILSSVLYIIINVRAELYFDSVLQLYYVYAGVVGFFWWSKRAFDSGGLQSIGLRSLWLPFLIIVLLSVLSGTLLQGFMDTNLSVADALVTCFSFYATWLTARMVIESWLIWIAIDITAAWMYWSKDLSASSFLYLFYTIAAIWAWYRWKKLKTTVQIP